MNDLINGRNYAEIGKMIFSLRGKEVILDRELARLYQVEVAQMNRQVKRNIERFPDDFMFQLTREELESLKCHFGISNSRGGDRTLPYAFTELGVSMLAGLLRSDIAINANIAIIRAFATMKRMIFEKSVIYNRLDKIELRQLESEMKITELFNKFEGMDHQSKEGVFFDGQIYDAYAFVSELIRSASRRIVLIDNYIDDTVLTMLDKRKDNVDATVYTSRMTKETTLDISKHNLQYRSINVLEFRKAHDRFLIIDDAVYLIGASIKDLGKKWFGFTLLESVSAQDIIKHLQEHI